MMRRICPECRNTVKRRIVTILLLADCVSLAAVMGSLRLLAGVQVPAETKVMFLEN